MRTFTSDPIDGTPESGLLQSPGLLQVTNWTAMIVALEFVTTIRRTLGIASIAIGARDVPELDAAADGTPCG